MHRIRRVGHLDSRLSSKGCFACIRMKVKCDQNRPQCGRCLAARRQCPGYRASATTFIVETGGTERLFTLSSLPPGRPGAPLPTDWIQNAVAHYVHHFVVEPDDGIPGMHDHIPHLYLERSGKAFLQNAVQAVAMASLARVNHMGSEHMVKAQRLYGDAMCHLRVALDTSDGCSAAALATTELLWEYDVIVGITKSPLASPHREGMFHILQTRLMQNSDDKPTATQGAFVNYTLQNIGQANISPTTHAVFELYPGMTQEAANYPACNLLGLMHQVVSLCGVVLSVLEHNEDVPMHAQRLQRLNEELLQWAAMVPEQWRYAIYSKPRNPHQEQPFPQANLIFHGVNTMMLWNCFWMARLDVLNCLDKLGPSLGKRGVIRTDVSQIVDMICSAVPYMAGQIPGIGGPGSQVKAKITGSLFATRALFVAGLVPDLPENKRLWISQQLRYLEQEAGIGQARVFREQLQRNRLVREAIEPHSRPYTVH